MGRTHSTTNAPFGPTANARILRFGRGTLLRVRPGSHDEMLRVVQEDNRPCRLLGGRPLDLRNFGSSISFDVDARARASLRDGVHGVLKFRCFLLGPSSRLRISSLLCNMFLFLILILRGLPLLLLISQVVVMQGWYCLYIFI
jgi:hypothetical protein